MDSNENHTCYYFDDVILIEDFDLDDISIDVKSNENILVYEILHKILIGSEPLRIRFNKIHGLIRIYGRTRYLVLFGNE